MLMSPNQNLFLRSWLLAGRLTLMLQKGMRSGFYLHLKNLTRLD